VFFEGERAKEPNSAGLATGDLKQRLTFFGVDIDFGALRGMQHRVRAFFRNAARIGRAALLMALVFSHYRDCYFNSVSTRER